MLKFHYLVKCFLTWPLMSEQFVHPKYTFLESKMLPLEGAYNI